LTNKPPAGLNAADYDAIEAAVMETGRDRWFLIENDRRRRAAETAQLLEAVTRLERAVGTGSAPAVAAPIKAAALPRAGSRAPAPRDRDRRAAAGHRLEHARARARRHGLRRHRRTGAAPGVAAGGCRHAGPCPCAPAASDPRLEALSRIDRMPLAEKLALFA
jgi:hypothetical protein